MQINSPANRTRMITVCPFRLSIMLTRLPHGCRTRSEVVQLRARHVALVALLGALLFCASRALAQSEPGALIDQQHCMFCHTNDAPFLAPSFQQIANRYRDVPHAQVMLEHKLREGGRPHWGDMAMPSPAERGGPLSPEDAHTLVEWVLRH